MRVIICEDYASMSKRAAFLFVAQLTEKGNSVLGLATGGTPVGFYEQVVQHYSKGEVDFSQATTFNLDEYVNLPVSDPNSYRSFMEENLFKHVNFAKERIHLPQGNAPDANKECERYEDAILAAGGIDIQLLGIGHNGHIGFNEPSGHFAEFTHLEKLTEKTREANARFFSSPDLAPTHAITMGIGTIMKARRIAMLVSGKDKAPTVRKMLNGEITPQLPASILRLHPDCILFVDKDAASEL